MIAILEKSKHNIDFHQIVDFIEVSYIRYALTINPTVYVSHIRQFWSTARIETTNEGTNILTTVDGKPKTISESSIRRNLKLNDEEGISSLLDTKLFENLALMGYNILPNQRFTFQKGQFSHQWKFLIHTIMQCLSPKSTGFSEFSSNIATAVGEGSTILTEPHHTPSPQAQQSPHHDTSSPSHPTSKALSTAANEPASLLRDDSQGEAFSTISGLDAGQDRENINKTSSLPHESTPRVTSLDANEGSMQQKLQELMTLYIGLQRQQTRMATKIEAQDLEIFNLKARIKLLEEKDRGSVEPFGDDAPIKGRSMKIGEEVGVERSTEVGSNDTKEMVNVLSSMEAANILTSEVAAVSVPPVVGVSSIGVSTVSGLVPTVSAIFTTASVKKLQEQIDAQVAREMEEEIEKEDQRMNEQLARDAEIVRLHAEEELKMMIEGLDRSNEMIEKHLQEYEQSEAELTIGEKIDLINELLDQGSSKRMETSEEVSEEDLKRMMQLVPIEEVYIEALQVKHPIINWEIHLEGKKDYWKIIRLGGHTAVYQQASRDKEKELWVELKRMFEPDFEDPLWTYTQNLMHDPLDWKLYDTCPVHYVSTKDQEIFMLVERDYPLRRGLAIVM
nr:hypothetical protein [Tanacetum cinerariifolium]